PPPPGGTIFRRGDTDGNGTVELTDAVFILGYLFQGSTTPACLETADSDDNGKIDVSDAIRLLGWLFAGGGPLAPPGSEECGRDPTPGDEGECDYDANSC
ncbi:MAG: dockerin type I domain-containing protein, partial [Planctomycetes bacterium]|nr:dockerin type I domain-containing protein [Planctomycetota bacterium]